MRLLLENLAQKNSLDGPNILNRVLGQGNYVIHILEMGDNKTRGTHSETRKMVEIHHSRKNLIKAFFHQ